MFSKILIANRGEIACRIIKTARRMGIDTVAVYSEADADALHVEMAGEAVFIGPAPAAQSYLVIDNIIDAVKQTGAEAVHPGFGFLSENPAFADALAAEDITFIGPNKRAVQAMGDKIASKTLADEVKVNTIPGYPGVIQDTDEARKIAADIGYPVMIKASAGGGGKGMRIARTEADLAAGFESAMNEARSAFGDDRVFIEKYVVEPRHIEIQVLGDKHGNIIHLCERECSIQRRNQKVIEEAPSPFVDNKLRRAMGKQAISLAAAVDYDSAGTVEFIVDEQGNFYFLEMNTRLQVEHPVTELVTGIDLVEQMIRIAAGEKLKLKQSDVEISGWALEARIYAEDPYRNFLPSVGRLVYYRPPQAASRDHGTIRNDTGVREGDEISIYYDPMIAKLCAHAPTRDEAVALMADALDEFHLEGIDHNIAFLAAVMSDGRFQSGALSTNYIDEQFPDGFHGAPLSEDLCDRLAALAAFVHGVDAGRARSIVGRLDAEPASVDGEWSVTLGRTRCAANLRMTAAGAQVVVHSQGNSGRIKEFDVECSWRPGDRVVYAKMNGAPMTVQLEATLSGWNMMCRGARVSAAVQSRRAAELAAVMPEKEAPDTSKYLLCPMPGLVVSISVAQGQEVKVGEPLAVVEAMKMENVLTAERDGIVSRITVTPGDSLAVDDVILEFE